LEGSQEIRALYKTVRIIEYDEIERQELAGIQSATSRSGKILSQGDVFCETSVEAWRKSRKHALMLLHGIFQSRVGNPEFFTNGHTLVIMDDNFFLRSMRREVFKVCQSNICENLEITFGLIHIDTSFEICVRRNEERTGLKKVPFNVILKMSHNFEEANANKAPWEQHNFKISIGEPSFNEVLRCALRCLHKGIDEPVKATIFNEKHLQNAAKDRSLTLKNKIHQTDILLRNIVGIICRRDKSYARIANITKKEVLSFAKSRALSSDEASLREEVIARYSDSFCSNMSISKEEFDEIFSLEL